MKQTGTTTVRAFEVSTCQLAASLRSMMSPASPLPRRATKRPRWVRAAAGRARSTAATRPPRRGRRPRPWPRRHRTLTASRRATTAVARRPARTPGRRPRPSRRRGSRRRARWRRTARPPRRGPASGRPAAGGGPAAAPGRPDARPSDDGAPGHDGKGEVAEALEAAGHDRRVTEHVSSWRRPPVTMSAPSTSQLRATRARTGATGCTRAAARRRRPGHRRRRTPPARSPPDRTRRSPPAPTRNVTAGTATVTSPATRAGPRTSAALGRPRPGRRSTRAPGRRRT